MIYAIFILCLILFAIAMYALRKLSKQYKTLQEIYYLQKLMLSHSQFTNDANEMILWKIRYDMMEPYKSSGRKCLYGPVFRYRPSLPKRDPQSEYAV